MKKSYYAIIPAFVRYDTNLTANAKLMYGEITALCNEKGYCFATNKYFADLYSVSNVSISKWINQLKDYGYIKVKIVYKENSKVYKPLSRLVLRPGLFHSIKSLSKKFLFNSFSRKNFSGSPFIIIASLLYKLLLIFEKIPITKTGFFFFIILFTNYT